MLTDARAWWCRLGLHPWRSVTFQHAPGVDGRYCVRCGKLQHLWPRFLGRSWRDTTLMPNEDADGYY